MTYTPIIYDWRDTVLPYKQVFFAGGTAMHGGMTIGGVSVMSPEPGGRAELRLEFAPIADATANLDASWLASRLMNGNIFRIRLFSPTVQLVPDSDLNGSTENGVNWSNNLGWEGDVPWAFDPKVGVVYTANAGATMITLNFVALGRVLKIGHLIGFRVGGYDFTHKVVDVSYDARDKATVTMEPPLRREVSFLDVAYLRPAMLATCVNAREAVGNFLHGTTMSFGPMRFVEALV
jgi:hypothetical protein